MFRYLCLWCLWAEASQWIEERHMLNAVLSLHSSLSAKSQDPTESSPHWGRRDWNPSLRKLRRGLYNSSFYSCQSKHVLGAQIRILMRAITAIKSTLYTFPNIASLIVFLRQDYTWCFHKTHTKHPKRQRIWILFLIH